MTTPRFRAELQCWRCKTQEEFSGPDESLWRHAVSMEGWQFADGLVWCPECWRSRRPSEGYSSKKRSDDVER